MADNYTGELHTPPSSTTGYGGPYLHRLREHSPSSTQVIGIIAFLIAGGILLLLAAATITAAVLGLILFGPIIVITSPIWVPVGTLLFIVGAGFLLACTSGLAAVAAVLWLYRYFRGLHPVGSDGVDYARSRIADTASHVKDYAREYGGYLQSKVKDAAPGA